MDGYRGVPNTFSTHNQIPESISGTRPGLMHVWIKIIKPVDIGDQLHLIISRWLVATLNLVLSGPIAMLDHTHRHLRTYLHNMFTPACNTLKNEISLSLMGSELGNLYLLYKLIGEALVFSLEMPHQISFSYTLPPNSFFLTF